MTEFLEKILDERAKHKVGKRAIKSRTPNIDDVSNYFFRAEGASYLSISYDGPKQLVPMLRTSGYAENSKIKGFIVVPNPYILSGPALDTFIEIFQSSVKLYPGRRVNLEILSSEGRICGEYWQMIIVRAPYHLHYSEYLRSINFKIDVPYHMIDDSKKGEVADVILSLKGSPKGPRKNKGQVAQKLFETVAQYISQSRKK